MNSSQNINTNITPLDLISLYSLTAFLFCYKWLDLRVYWCDFKLFYKQNNWYLIISKFDWIKNINIDIINDKLQYSEITKYNIDFGDDDVKKKYIIDKNIYDNNFLRMKIFSNCNPILYFYKNNIYWIDLFNFNIKIYKIIFENKLIFKNIIIKDNINLFGVDIHYFSGSSNIMLYNGNLYVIVHNKFLNVKIKHIFQPTNDKNFCYSFNIIKITNLNEIIDKYEDNEQQEKMSLELTISISYILWEFKNEKTYGILFINNCVVVGDNFILSGGVDDCDNIIIQINDISHIEFYD